MVEDGDAEINASTGRLDIASDNTGTITVTVTTAGKNSSDQYLTDSVDVEITGDPVVTVVSALSGYSGKNTSLAFTYSNFTGALNVVSGDTSKVTVQDLSASAGSGTIQVNFVAAGSSTLTFKDGSSDIATCVVTVTASAVSSVAWTSASNMTVYSGSTALNAAKITSWAPTYEMNNGDNGSISSDYTIQLNGSAYSLGTALEAGTYAVSLTYGGQTTSVNPIVTVIQSINDIISSDTYSWTAGSGDQTTIAEAGADGSFIIGGQSWAIERDNTATTNLTSGAIQIGANGNATNFSLTSNFGAGSTITKVTVQCASYNSDTSASTGLHDISITVGGTSYYDGATPRWASNATGPVSGTGSSKGDVVITYTANSGARAAYLKAIEVQYTSNVSNASGHETAQAKVVEFAQYLNTQMNGTNVCSGTGANLSTAWGNVSAKYTALFGAETSLSESELAFAKVLLASASASWNESHDSDEKYCLERAMKTYEWCVSNRGQTAFMSAVRPVSSRIETGNIVGASQDSTVATIVTVTSLITVTALGAFLFLKKRKEI